MMTHFKKGGLPDGGPSPTQTLFCLKHLSSYRHQGQDLEHEQKSYYYLGINRKDWMKNNIWISRALSWDESVLSYKINVPLLLSLLLPWCCTRYTNKR